MDSITDAPSGLRSAGLVSQLMTPPSRPPPPLGYSAPPPSPPARTSASNLNMIHSKPPTLTSPPLPPAKSSHTEVVNLFSSDSGRKTSSSGGIQASSKPAERW